MTRINVVPPSELLDQHLLAEYRELPRVFALARVLPVGTAPSNYVLGSGHVKFFYDKTGFLSRRQEEIIQECLLRGWAIQHTRAPEPVPGLERDWVPDDRAVRLNLRRLRERFLEKPQIYTFWGTPVGLDFYDLDT